MAYSVRGASSTDTANMGEPRVRYTHKDRRKNIFELNLQDEFEGEVAEQARSVAVLVSDFERYDGFRLSGRSGNLEDFDEYAPTLAMVEGGKFGYGEQESFGSEHVYGYGTAFLIDDRHALTAGHCVCEENTNILMRNITKTALVFEFYRRDRRQNAYRFYKDDIYRIKKVVAWCNEGSDWAVVKLDRVVIGRTPLSISFGKKTTIGDEVYMLGHPSCLPMKYTYGAQVKRNGPWCFDADLDGFKGNSGSPVFDKKSLRVIGILVRGPKKDYYVDSNYRNTGLKKTAIYRLSNSEIARSGYEKIQRLTVPYISAFAQGYILAWDGTAEEKYAFGVACFKGEGVARNKKEGLKWIRRAERERPSLSVDEFKAEHQLTIKEAVLEHRCIHQWWGKYVATALSFIHPNFYIEFMVKEINIVHSRRFEWLALQDDRFMLFTHLGNNEIKEADAEFNANRSFFRRLSKTKTFVNAFKVGIASIENEDVEGKIKYNRYINFFVEKRIIPRRFKKKRFSIEN